MIFSSFEEYTTSSTTLLPTNSKQKYGTSTTTAMERKFKWLLSCLSLGVLLIYSNHHILLQPPEHQKLNHGFYHQECQCYRDINIEQDVVEDTFLNYSSLTCSSVSGKL